MTATNDFAQLAADIISNLPDGTTAADARRALQELDPLDQTAALAVGGGGGGGGGSQTVNVATLPLTDANIKALGDNSTVIVAGVPNNALVTLSAFLTLDSSHNPYGNINTNGFLWVGVISQAFASDRTLLTYLLNDSSTGFDQLTKWLTGAGPVAHLYPNTVQAPDPGWGQAACLQDSLADFAGQPILLACDNGGDGPFNGGDALNSGSISVTYATVPMPA